MSGVFIIIDGMDGGGKGVFIDAMSQEATKQGYSIFDLHDYWQQHQKHPDIESIKADIIISSEPTYVLAGSLIRNELIKTGTNYSATAIAQAYALDRQILYDKVIIPARKKGIHIIQSRSVSTSLIYQPIDAKQKNEVLLQDDVAKLPGNATALEHNPDALILLLLDPKEAMARLDSREKKDNASFEKLSFQETVHSAFLDDSFKELYKRAGTKILYPNVEQSIEHTQLQAKKIFNKFIPRLQ